MTYLQGEYAYKHAEEEAIERRSRARSQKPPAGRLRRSVVMMSRTVSGFFSSAEPAPPCTRAGHVTSHDVGLFNRVW